MDTKLFLSIFQYFLISLFLFSGFMFFFVNAADCDAGEVLKYSSSEGEFVCDEVTVYSEESDENCENGFAITYVANEGFGCRTFYNTFKLKIENPNPKDQDQLCPNQYLGGFNPSGGFNCHNK